MNDIVGTYSWVHILYILLVIPAFVLGIHFLSKKNVSEKAIDWVLYIGAGILLCVIIAQRIDIVYQAIQEGKVKHTFWGEDRTYNWFMVLPDSICGLISLLTPFFIWFGRKKENRFAEAIYVVALLGCLGTIFYPDYLNFYPLHQIRCWGGLIHHVLTAWLLTLMLVRGRFSLSLRRWWLNPVLLAAMGLYGVFCLFVLNFASCMDISSPLIDGLVVSYYWGLCIAYFAANIVTILIYEAIMRKKKQREEAAE